MQRKDCDISRKKVWRYQQQMSNVDEHKVHKRIFVEGQLIFIVANYVIRNISTPSTFAPNWEGLYIVKEVLRSRYYNLCSIMSLSW